MSNFKIIYGKNIYLKGFLKKNITSNYINWLNDPEVVKFSNQRFIHHTKESCINYFKTFENSDDLFFGIYLSKPQSLVGTINAYIDKRNGLADLGIMIGDKNQWGQGIGLNAWKILMEHLFINLKIRKITAGTLRPNTGMIRIMERAGMYLETVRLRHYLFNKNAEDVLCYAKFANS